MFICLSLFHGKKLQHKHYDYFIFGHRHLPLDLKVGQNSKYINLGDWIQDFTFAVFDGEKLELQQFDKP